METEGCFGCGGEFPKVEGPVHEYMASCPGCWAAFGEVLAREYSDETYFEVHRLSVDAYAVQHPGLPSRQTIQSIGVHLIRLCLFLERDLTPERANDAMLKAGTNKSTFIWLEPPESLGEITVVEVANTVNSDEHKIVVKEWARGAWEAWSPHHQQVKAWMVEAGLD